QHHKGISSDVAETFKGRIRFAFIDGDHSYDAVCRDIDAVHRFLAPGGWIAFDDAFSSYDGVSRAIEDRIINSGKYDYAQQLTRKCFVARRRAD
ncbi:MAG TPA: class I SAM-dependent methyltransferase, partial [Thermoanaerobaculia bacterium]